MCFKSRPIRSWAVRDMPKNFRLSSVCAKDENQAPVFPFRVGKKCRPQLILFWLCTTIVFSSTVWCFPSKKFSSQELMNYQWFVKIIPKNVPLTRFTRCFLICIRLSIGLSIEFTASSDAAEFPTNRQRRLLYSIVWAVSCYCQLPGCWCGWWLVQPRMRLLRQ